jgi:uncharacterized caspase-like protein
MRKALIIGIDYYTHLEPLSGCVADALAVTSVLRHHADGSNNFVTPRTLKATSQTELVKRGELKDAVRELFEDNADVALLYFAGHGYIEDTGGFLCASDCKTGDDGFPLSEFDDIGEQIES